MSLYSLPHLQVIDTTTQSIAVAGTPQIVTFNTDVYNRKMIHSTVTNPGRITCIEGGQYNLTATLQASTASAGKTLDIWIRKNGTDIPNTNVKTIMANANDQKDTVVDLCFPLVAGDYIEMWINGDSTSIVLTSTAAGTTPTRPVTPSVAVTLTKV